MRRTLFAAVSLAVSMLAGGLAALSDASAQTAAAQPAATFPAPGDDLILTLGGGLRVRPEWEGSKSYIVSPFPLVSFRFVTDPLTGQPTSDLGFGITPAFRYISERNGSMDHALRGLRPVDAALEAGVRLDYTWQYMRVFMEARQGFGGQTGQHLDFGVDAIVRPTAQLVLSAGPRVGFASDDYMDTYFSVTRKEAAKTKFSTYNADGGLQTYGIAGRADYSLTPQWLLRLEGGWFKLAPEAADSPIVRKAGDSNQFSIGVGAAYKFGIDYK
jgi:outer membrane protein